MAEEREAFEKRYYTAMTAEPSELLRRVFDAHTQHYGDPDMHYPFESEKSVFARLDVFAWHPHDEIPMTTFTTIGMADHEMQGYEHRCAIHMTIRKMGNSSGDIVQHEIKENALRRMNLISQ